jgi:hypothetical protein
MDVVLGPPANTVLDANANMNSLTLLATGGVTVNQTLTSNHFDLQGDGSITGVGGPDSTRHGGVLIIASGGSFTKSGGSGTFSFGTGQPGVTLSGDNCTLIVQSSTLEMPFSSGNGGMLYNVV